MRTGRTLTVFQWRTPPKIPPKNLEEPPQKIPPQKYPLPKKDTPPPVDRMTHASENITLAKTSFRPVIKLNRYKKGKTRMYGQKYGEV